jgi:hypothetical protein
MKQKLIVVAYAMGRVGSSAMMGLLGKMGASVGDSINQPKPSSMNPKGFFELFTQRDFMHEVFDNFYPNIVSPPTFDDVDSIAEAHYHDYQVIIEREFSSHKVAAVKSQRMLTLPMLSRLANHYEISIIA